MSFSKDQILRMYPNVQYYVKNSNGGLLAGTIELKDAIKTADKFKKEYMEDRLNNHLDVFVYDKKGDIIYTAGNTKEKLEEEEFE